MQLQPHKVGLTVGSMFGLLHLGWSILVALGLAGTLMDFIYHLHFMTTDHNLLPFSFSTALALVVITSLIGYIIGHIFAKIWNHLVK